MTGPYRSRKDRFNRDGKRPILIRDEKIENGVDFYLVEYPNVAWHWRPRNKIWGWRRLYDEFLFSKRQRQERQIYANNNDIDVINPSPPSIRDDR
ncbi:10131_t:CDS:2, partial [Rhizophagus irregularis]